MSKKATLKKPSSNKNSRQVKLTEKEKINIRKKEIAAIIFFVSGLFLFFLALLKGSSFWNIMHNIYFGLFGIISYIIPILFMGMGVLLTSDKILKITKFKLIQIVIAVFLSSAFVHILVYDESPGNTFLQTITYIYQDGVNSLGGGVFGAVFGWPLLAFLGKPGATITILLSLMVFILLVTGLTLLDVFKGFKKPIDIINEERKKQIDSTYDTHIDRPLPSHPVTSSSKIDIDLEEATSKKVFSLFTKKTQDDFSTNPMETFIKQDPTRTIASVIDVPFNNTNSLNHLEDGSSSDIEQKNIENLSEIEQLVRKAVPIETISLSDVTKEQISLKENEEKNDFVTNDGIFSLERENLEKNSTPINVFNNKTIKPVFFPENFKGKILSTNKNITPKEPEEELLPKYEKPHFDLLNDVTIDVDKNITLELKESAQTLVDTLKSFGVETKVVNISRGPTVTRYELQPKAGVKISRITNLSDDIALNLAAAGVRIEAPIPGKPAVGIEVPNKKTNMVGLKEIVKSKEFQTSKSKLTFALGKDITGKSIVADIAKMPHMLIAGATGSGKSVCINSIITSLTYQASPDEVRFLMIDPKIVELGIYNGIPHLLIPVVTDPKKAAGALNWAVAEMQKRYNTFAKNQVRDLKSYNLLAKKTEELEMMPQIVIIIDELSDLMMVAPTDVESAICRLAQMARAAGMHLVIATQRPSVDVITGVIKANIPSRIAFSVSSAVDSRTILDSSGAEKLLGRGDMLFSPAGSPKPSRVQGCFVDDKEVERIVRFLKKDDEPDYNEDIIEEIENLSNDSSTVSGNMADETDDLLDEAIEVIFENNQASTSFLQRRLRVGYARAARMMDMIEDRGIISPQDGSKPRDILISKDQWIQITMRD